MAHPVLNYRVAKLLKIGKKIKNKVQNKLEDFLSFPKCAKIAGKISEKSSEINFEKSVNSISVSLEKVHFVCV